jgi:hypothetical protein
VAGHVVEVSGVRAQAAKQVGRAHRPLGLVRHLHDVDMQMQERRMRRTAARFGQRDRAFTDRERFEHIRVACRPPGRYIPQPAWRSGDQRFDEERGDIEIVRMGEMDPTQRSRVVIVPARILCPGHRVRLLEAAGKRLDQLDLQHGCAPVACAGPSDVRRCQRRGRRRLRGAELMPGQVVERTTSVGDAPVCHDAGRIIIERALEAADSLLLMEAEAPVQPSIKPGLRLWRLGGDFAAVATKVEGIRCHDRRKHHERAGCQPAHV